MRGGCTRVGSRRWRSAYRSPAVPRAACGRVDILYNLYDLVTIGGYIIIDDFGWDESAVKGDFRLAKPLFGAKQALLDFRMLHGIRAPMKDIDGTGAYFQKTSEVELRRSTYELAVQRKRYTNLTAGAAPGRKNLTKHDYYTLMNEWEATRSAEEITRVVNSRGLIRDATCAGAPLPPCRRRQ
jgi:hypothetical protein